MGDAIASYAFVTGRLRTENDSLKSEIAEWQHVPVQQTSQSDSLTDLEKSFLEKARLDALTLKSLIDTTFVRQQQFGNGLFVVTGLVEFRGNQFRQHLQLEQIRDIRLDVTTTISDDQTRILTYVTSDDFESLEYKSFTELKPNTKLPKFWIGVAVGVAGSLGASIILN